MPVTTRSSASQRRGLHTLPEEVLQRITSYISREDAKSLATVCKAVRDAAESVIWRKLDMRVSPEWMDDLPPFMTYLENVDVENPPHYNDYGSGFSPTGWEDDDGVKEQKALLFERKLESRVMSMQKGLDARPRRAGAARHFNIMLCGETIDPIRELLDRVGEHLRFITIREHTEMPYLEIASVDGCESLSKLFRRMWTMKKLVNLTIGIPITQWQKDLGGLLANSTSIRRVRITCHRESSFGPAREAEMVHPPAKSRSLNHLDVDLLDDYFAWIIALIGQAPSLTSLRILADAADWPPLDLTPDDQKTIAIHPALQRMDLRGSRPFNRWVDEMLQLEGLDKMEEIVKGESIETVSGFHIQRVVIPPLNNLKSLILPIIGSQWTKHPEKPIERRLCQQFINELSAAPKLEAILGIREVRYSPAFETDMNTWCKKAVSGILIRTYTEGDDHLIHIRHLQLRGDLSGGRFDYSRAISEEYEGPLSLHEIRECLGIACPNHQWTSTTDFNGQPVPDQVLLQVYNTVGEEVEFTSTGREMSLPQEGWDILRKWRGTGPSWEDELGQHVDLAEMRAVPEYDQVNTANTYHAGDEEEQVDYVYYSPIDSGSPGGDFAYLDAYGLI